MPSRLDTGATGAQLAGCLTPPAPAGDATHPDRDHARQNLGQWLGHCRCCGPVVAAGGAGMAGAAPQFARLAFPLFIMNLLSGGHIPLDSMPQFLQMVMQGSPSTHFVSVAQAILYHGASFDVVWREFAATAAIGAMCFVGALLRFRKALTAMQL